MLLLLGSSWGCLGERLWALSVNNFEWQCTDLIGIVWIHLECAPTRLYAFLFVFSGSKDWGDVLLPLLPVLVNVLGHVFRLFIRVL